MLEDQEGCWEIRKAVMKLRNGKASSQDNIAAEALSADLHMDTEILHGLLEKI